MLVDMIAKHLSEYVKSKGFDSYFSNNAFGIKKGNIDYMTSIYFGSLEMWVGTSWEDFTLSDPLILDKLKETLDHDMGFLSNYTQTGIHRS